MWMKSLLEEVLLIRPSGCGVVRTSVECPITSHLRSSIKEYFEYQLHNIFWM
jgi:hypothetical protein